MNVTLKSLLIITMLTPIPSFAESDIQRLDYSGFTIWLDCDKRAATRFRYNAHRDTGNAKRHGQFYQDKKVPAHCQQKSTSSYKGKHPTGRYDRGHLVPANHMDSDKRSIRDSNYMTNIIPQAANANRGACLRTEEIIECYRDIDELLIVGGVIWGNNTKDDYFYKTHGIRTPDAMWKVVLRGSKGNERIISWIVPNINDAKRKQLDKYLVSVNDIERITGQRIAEVPSYLKAQKEKNSWITPKGCDRS